MPAHAPLHGQMRNRHHGLCVDLVIADRQNLLGGGFRDQRKTFTARAAHAESIPTIQPIKRVVGLEQCDENLVRTGGLGRAARGGEDAIGNFGVGDDCRLPFQRYARAAPLDRRRARAHVAAGAALGGRRGKEKLLAANPAQQALMPSAALSVARQAGHIGQVHGIDHGSGCAAAAEHVADIDNIGDARALAAKFRRHGNAQQPFGARGANRLTRKSRMGIDGCGVRGCNGGNLFGARRQIGRIRCMQIACSNDETTHGTSRGVTVIFDIRKRHGFGIPVCTHDPAHSGATVHPTAH